MLVNFSLIVNSFVWEHCPHAYQSLSGPLVARKPSYHVHVVMVTSNPTSIPQPLHSHTDRPCLRPPHNIPDAQLPTSRAQKANCAACWFENSHSPCTDCPHSPKSSCLQVYTHLRRHIVRWEKGNKHTVHAFFSLVIYYRHHVLLCTKNTMWDR